jgi:hypothetical protein
MYLQNSNSRRRCIDNLLTVVVGVSVLALDDFDFDDDDVLVVDGVDVSVVVDDAAFAGNIFGANDNVAYA